MKLAFAKSQATVEDLDLKLIEKFKAKDCIHFIFVDGVFQASLSEAPPEGVEIRIADAVEAHSEEKTFPPWML